MRIAITGATGLIGKGLTRLLLQRGHDVRGLSRDRVKAAEILGDDVTMSEWSTRRRNELVNELEGTDAFVNLAGENIGSSRWTAAKQKRIVDSRLSAGKLATDVIGSLSRKPEIFLQASAVGFYGSRGEEVLDETSAQGDGYLADVVRKWEASTQEIESLGIRRVIIRTGVVLSPEAGALSKLALPYKLLVGALPGSGKQWISWIHYSDELEAIYFLLTQGSSSGVYNAVSPNPVRMETLCTAIGRALHRQTILKIPEPLLKLSLGKMAEETILTSQKVVPKRLAEAGFEFRYTEIETSVADLLSKGIH